MAKKKKKLSKLAKAKANPMSSYWDKRALRAWSRVVRKGGECQMCGATGRLDAHHIIPKEVKAYRHEERNGLCLCVRCHKWDRTMSPHQNAIGFYLWLNRTMHIKTQVTIFQWAFILQQEEPEPKESYKHHALRLEEKLK